MEEIACLSGQTCAERHHHEPTKVVEAFWLPAQIVTQYKRKGRTCKQVHLDLQASWASCCMCRGSRSTLHVRRVAMGPVRAPQ